MKKFFVSYKNRSFIISARDAGTAINVAEQLVSEQVQDGVEKYYMAKYTTPDRKEHKVYFRCDGNMTDAERKLDEIIPEPYISARVLGTAPRGVEREGFKLLEDERLSPMTYHMRQEQNY